MVLALMILFALAVKTGCIDCQNPAVFCFLSVFFIAKSKAIDPLAHLFSLNLISLLLSVYSWPLYIVLRMWLTWAKLDCLFVSLGAGMCEENWDASTVRLRVTERASLANLLRPNVCVFGYFYVVFKLRFFLVSIHGKITILYYIDRQCFNRSESDQ